MKRIIVLSSLIMAMVLLSGCGKKDSSKEADKSSTKKESVSTVVSSIKDAMGLGKTMECTYKMPEEGKEFVSKTYVNGKKYKSQFTVNGKNTISLFDGEDSMYSWVEGEKTGTKFKISCLGEIKDVANNSNDNKNTPSIEAGEEAFDDATEVKCQPAEGVDFSLPNGVVFQDQCEMFKNLSKSFSTVPVAE